MLRKQSIDQGLLYAEAAPCECTEYVFRAMLEEQVARKRIHGSVDFPVNPRFISVGILKHTEPHIVCMRICGTYQELAFGLQNA